MSGFFDYIRQVILVALMVQVAQMLVPSGEIRGYVRLVCGLLVLAAVASPLVHLIPQLEGEWDEWEGVPGVNASEDELEEAARTGVREREDLTASVYAERLSSLIAGEIQMLPGVREADLQVDVAVEVDGTTGELREIRVSLAPGAGEGSEEGGGRAVTVDPIRVGDERPGDGEETGEVPGELHGEVQEYLRVTYGLQEKQVHLRWMEGDG